MQTRLIKNAQRKQTVFLHRGIYRWTNFLTLDIRPRTSVPSLKFFYLFSVTFLLFLFSFVFFFSIKKFLLSNTLFNYTRSNINFTFLPIFIFLFSKFFQKFLKFLTILHIVLFRRLFFLYFIFL